MATLARPIISEYTRMPANVRRLDANDVAVLPLANQVVRVLSGAAWVTLNQDDIIVKSGEKITLYPDKYPPVISALDNRQLVYEIII
ncbi:MAG: hypothetical protein HXY41_14020 [Chloroflexi bacterium]|nr:hypothetical protein [Chloroflexota bacterium]